MSDAIHHECGIALLRLKKPLDYYVDKYNTAFYGINKMYLLMEKQHNRGQDGAGLANIKLDMTPGERYISRRRSVDQKPIQDIFTQISKRFAEVEKEYPEKMMDVDYLKKNLGFTGELFLGHLKDGTNGNRIETCHPFLRQNNWMTRNLVLAGNFNLTNVDELFDVLLNLGQHPKEKSDAVTVLEKIGHFLDVENEELFRFYKTQGYNNREITSKIVERLDIQKILKRASGDFDGGYVMAGLMGHGDAFVLRDPNGIRPAFWYEDDEICVVTSERPVLQTAFDLKQEDIQELTPGSALIIRKSGEVSETEINPPQARKACSFERIYFSRGNDADIYRERKRLGEQLVPKIMESINNELDDAVFSFIPNTAEMSYYGMIKGLEDVMNEEKLAAIRLLKNGKEDDAKLLQILNRKTRIEKIAIKDVKLRTFISEKGTREDMAAHVYDITYGTVNRHKDNLVVIDDSIVRGTTLKQSILRILDRLDPKKIVVVSSAPQIRYPDFYGIQMAKMEEFIAFHATIELLKESGKTYIIDEVYKKCSEQILYPKEQIKNYVKEIYEPFSPDEISKKIAEILRPVDMKSELEIIYQSIENLHEACPNNKGDWYFTGNYPTPGGNKLVCQAFIDYYEERNR